MLARACTHLYTHMHKNPEALRIWPAADVDNIIFECENVCETVYTEVQQLMGSYL